MTASSSILDSTPSSLPATRSCTRICAPKKSAVSASLSRCLNGIYLRANAAQYNGRDIDTLEHDIDSRIVDLMNLIRDCYHGVSMDIAVITRFFTLDVLSTVAFGKPFGFMAANRDLWDYNKTTSQSMMILEWSVNHKLFRWLFATPLMQALAAPKVTDKTGMGPALAFAREAVAERYGPSPKVKRDMLGHFVSKGLSQLRCEAEAYLQIIAGSDSTTTVLRSTLFLLVGHPTAYSKLRSEIDTAVRDGRASYPVMTYAEALKLPYLQACIWEGLRMYPPLFGLKAKLAPPGGETVKGIYFPAGVEVAVCDDAMCRRKDIFGADAHLFRPDRWLDADADTRVKFRQTVDTVFGSGRFMCLGRHIALMELHKALAEVSRESLTPVMNNGRACHFVLTRSPVNPEFRLGYGGSDERRRPAPSRRPPSVEYESRGMAEDVRSGRACSSVYRTNE